MDPEVYREFEVTTSRDGSVWMPWKAHATHKSTGCMITALGQIQAESKDNVKRLVDDYWNEKMGS